MTQRTLAIGDIHGCDTALRALIDTVQPTPEDEVIVLGDVVDRGPDSRRCVEQLLKLRQSCHLVFLMGNHEEMMLNALGDGDWSTGWLVVGGRETLESYGGDPHEIPGLHLEFLASGVDFHQTDSAIFVHANLEPDVPLECQKPEWLRWNHLSGWEPPHPSGKQVICGHTRLTSGKPAILNGWICIDTAACADGWLTCLDVDEMTVWQANELGDVRGPMKLDEIGEEFQRRE